MSTSVDSTQIITYAVVALPFIVLLWCALIYNALVRLRNQCREAWSDIDTELKRRYDLIPNLVEVVRGYAAYEQETLQKVVEARQRAIASQGTPAAQAQDEKVLVDSLRSLLLVAEKYPQLKASGPYLKLQGELVDTEDRIQAARRFYNANVRDYNTRVQTIPSNLIARLGGFQAAEFFEVDSAVVGVVPRV